MTAMKTSSQSGNMLVYILGAVFLMGLLIILVKGSSNPGGGIDSETVVIHASDAQRYASEVENAIRFIMQNGHSESDIRFSHPNADSAYGAVLTPPLTRQVFDPAGGAAEFRDPPQGVNDGTKWQFFGNTHITDMGTDEESGRRAELIMVLPNVTQPFCERINQVNDQALDVAAGIQDPGAGGCIFATGSEYTGTFTNGAGANVLDDTLFTHNPASQACVRCSDGSLHFYHVLMAR